MKYFEAIEYKEFQPIIEDMLENGYTHTPAKISHTFLDKPPILEEKYFDDLHDLYKELVGTSKGLLKVCGFYKPDVKQRGNLQFVCQCHCKKYTIIKTKTFVKCENLVNLCCEQCNNEVFSFNNAFRKLTNSYLSEDVIFSILFSIDYAEQPFVRKSIDGTERVRKNNFDGLSDQDLKELLQQDSPKANSVFELTEDGQTYKNPRREGVLARMSVVPYKMAELHEDVAVNIRKSIHKKLFRLTILGLVDNGKPQKTRDISFACQCDCGSYIHISYEGLNTNSFPACAKCYSINAEIIARQKHNNDVKVSVKEAWDLLGENTSIVAAQVMDIKNNTSNAYTTPRKVYDPDTSYEQYQKIFGLQYGLVTIVAKSRRFKPDYNGYQIAGVCICGNECIFPYEILKNTNNRQFLACSSCTTDINNALNSQYTKAVGGKTHHFQKQWKAYLEYYKLSTDIPFIPVYENFLKMRKENTSLTFLTEVKRLAENYTEN